jgi:SAM-dependent methyltransferase
MSKTVYEPRPQVPTEHYWLRAYNTKERMCSYWHQVDEVLGLDVGTVLEVGPGGGLVTDWLRRAGVQVTTLDMDPAVGADVQGSVSDMPLESGSFDAVMCCQVLEHLPFTDAEQALRELARVSRVGAVVSVPDATPWAGKSYPLYFPGWYLEELRAQLPTTRLQLVRDLVTRRLRLRDWLFLRFVPSHWSLGGRTLDLRLPIPRGPWRPEPGNQHFWEVGAEGTPLARLLAAAQTAGFVVERTYRVPENPWHRFLILRKRG